MPTPKAEPQTVTSTQNTTPWSAQQPYLKEGFAAAKDLYGQGPQSFFPGQTYASPSSATTGALTAIENRANAGNPLLGQAQGEASKVLSGAYLDPNTNPGFQSVLDTTRANTLPGLDARFMGAGRSGSGLHGRSVGLGLGEAIGGLTYGNYNAERGRMENAMAAAPGLAQADYADPQMLGAAGAERDRLAQQPITEAIARHDYGQAAPNQALAQYMQMISGNYGGQSTGTTQQFLPQQNPWTTGLGLGLGILGTGASLFSDERLKEDIKRVGETDDGLGIYSYRYKWGGPPHLGVMAQEAADKKPEAVSVAPLFGQPFLTVDYERIS